MGKYERRAREHAKEIQHCYDNAGSTGYSQAKYPYAEISNLLARAYDSKNNKKDAAIILILKKTADPLMQEMKKRESQFVMEQKKRESLNRKFAE